MECISLLQSLDHIGYTGICIGTEKSQLLKNSLLILHKENHFEKTYYWGRVNGIHKDYHIAYGHGRNCLKDSVYYYSLNCIDWLLLPKFSKYEEFVTSLAANLFIGDPAVVTNIDVPDEILVSFKNANSIKKSANASVVQIPKDLKEESRLAATIHRINECAMIVPRGSLLKHANGDITRNPAFAGLTLSESVQLKSYLHSRPARQKLNINLSARPDYNYSLDFLDSIVFDVPKDCWKLELHMKDGLTILQNLYWPGMTFYQLIDSPHYGSIYMGNGKENLDIPFMI